MPRLKLVLNDPLAPLESRMINDSNFRCDLPSDSNLGRLWKWRENIFIQGKSAKVKKYRKLFLRSEGVQNSKQQQF